MLADGLEVDNNGYFLYEMSSGRFDLYPLVRKESLASSAQSIGLLELSEHSEKDGKDDDSVKRVKSARTSKWRITSAAFQEKQSLERAKTLMYRPSTFGVAAEEDLKGGPGVQAHGHGCHGRRIGAVPAERRGEWDEGSGVA